MTLCEPIGRYQYEGGMFLFHLQGRRRWWWWWWWWW